MTHTLDEATATTTLPDGRLRAEVHPAWGNMVGPYGGITAATIAAAIERHPEAQGRIAALTINFLSALTDAPWELEPRPARTNRSNQHWTLRATQEGNEVLTATAITAADREDWEDTELVMPTVSAPEAYDQTAISFPVAWLHNYEMRFVSGPMPTHPAELGADSETVFWIRSAKPRAWDVPALISVSDAYYPRIFRRLGAQTPAGTITLTTYVHASAEELAAQSEYVLLRAQASRYARGMFDQRGEVWGADGKLLATTHQLVYFKSPKA